MKFSFHLLFSIALILISFSSCKTKKILMDQAHFSGKISNHQGNNGSLTSENFDHPIPITSDGKFDTYIKLDNSGKIYSFTDGNEYTEVFLKNGDDVYVELDTKEFDESLKYTGRGSVNSNFLAQKLLFRENNLIPGLFDLSESDFDLAMQDYKQKFLKFVKNYKNLDSKLRHQETANTSNLITEAKKQYTTIKAQKKILGALTAKPSPSFENFENIDGSTTSLSDLAGYYVYIDVWATWCGPCKAEIPHLQELEETYASKKIKFVSLSVDGMKDKMKWKKMIADKKMGGIQLFADKSWRSSFVKAYHINGIPRFIFLDDKGIVLNPDAPRPSQHDKIKKMLEVVE